MIPVTDLCSRKDLLFFVGYATINAVPYFRVWRRLVARLTGGQEAVGSSPATRTTSPQASYRLRRLFYKSHRRAHYAASPFPQKVPLRLRCLLVNARTTLRLATNFLRACLRCIGVFSSPIIPLGPRRNELRSFRFFM